MIVEWALALPLTTAFADGYTSAPVKARPLSTNETMEFRLWSSACLRAASSGRARKSPSFASNSTYAGDQIRKFKQIARPNFPRILLLRFLVLNLALQLFLLVFEIFLNFFPRISRLSSILYFTCFQLVLLSFRISKLFANTVEMYNLFTFLKKGSGKRTIKISIAFHCEM